MVRHDSYFFSCFFVGERARITGVGMENDSLEYIEWSEKNFKTDGHFPDSSVWIKKILKWKMSGYHLLYIAILK